MSELINAGRWVQVHAVALSPDERAYGLPEDTARLPYEYWVKGFLTKAAPLGSEASITTLSGRTVTGTLTAVDLAYAHSFGTPHPAMLAIGPELRRILAPGGGE